MVSLGWDVNSILSTSAGSGELKPFVHADHSTANRSIGRFFKWRPFGARYSAVILFTIHKTKACLQASFLKQAPSKSWHWKSMTQRHRSSSVYEPAFVNFEESPRCRDVHNGKFGYLAASGANADWIVTTLTSMPESALIGNCLPCHHPNLGCCSVCAEILSKLHPDVDSACS